MHITLINSLLANFSRVKGKLMWHWQIQLPFAKYYYLLLMLIQSLAGLHSYRLVKFVALQNPQLNGAVKTLLKEVHPSIKCFNSHMSYKNCVYIYLYICCFNLHGLYTTHFTFSVTLQKSLDCYTLLWNPIHILWLICWYMTDKPG